MDGNFASIGIVFEVGRVRVIESFEKTTLLCFLTLRLQTDDTSDGFSLVLSIHINLANV